MHACCSQQQGPDIALTSIQVTVDFVVACYNLNVEESQDLYNGQQAKSVTTSTITTNGTITKVCCKETLRIGMQMHHKLEQESPSRNSFTITKVVPSNMQMICNVIWMLACYFLLLGASALLLRFRVYRLNTKRWAKSNGT